MNNLTTENNLPNYKVNYSSLKGVRKFLRHRFSLLNTYKAWYTILIIILFFYLGGFSFIQNILFDLSLNNEYFTKYSFANSATSLFQLISYLFCLTLPVILLVYYLFNQESELILKPDIIILRYFAGIKQFTYPRNILIAVKFKRENNLKDDGEVLLEFSNKKALKLQLKYFFDDQSKRFFLDYLQNTPQLNQIDSGLIDLLSKPDNQSYTQLWLEALSNEANISNLTNLPLGYSLYNNRYTILSQIAVGGYSIAYLAYDNVIQKNCVLKEYVLSNSVHLEIQKKVLQDIEKEYKLLKDLNNPKIVKVLAMFVENSRAYLVLENITGKSLRQLIADNKNFSQLEVIDLAYQMIEILSFLHNLNTPIIHNDFTPENLILDADSILHLIDFNISNYADTFTTSLIAGKPSYTSAEQVKGHLNVQNDIYALGASLYFLLTNQDPEPLAQSSPRSINHLISKTFDEVIQKCTNQDLKFRYKNVLEIKDDLDKI